MTQYQADEVQTVVIIGGTVLVGCCVWLAVGGDILWAIVTVLR